MIRPAMRAWVLLLAGVVVQPASAACEIDSMRRDLLKLGRADASPSKAWQRCLDELQPERPAQKDEPVGDKQYEALLRARRALEGEFGDTQSVLDRDPLQTILENLKFQWQDSDALGKLCWEAELRTYAAALVKRAPTLREMGFGLVADLEKALAGPQAGVQRALGFIARWDDQPARCLSTLEEAAKQAGKPAAPVLAHGAAPCSDLVAAVRAAAKPAVEPPPDKIANCPTGGEPRLRTAVQAWCDQPDARHWSALVRLLSDGGTAVTSQVTTLVPASRPPGLRTHLEDLGYFARKPAMPPDRHYAVAKVRDGVKALESLQRSVLLLRRATAFQEGMELLLQGDPTKVRARLDQEPEWNADARLKALDTVARFWASGERPASARAWNTDEQEVFQILGLTGP